MHGVEDDVLVLERVGVGEGAGVLRGVRQRGLPSHLEEDRSAHGWRHLARHGRSIGEDAAVGQFALLHHRSQLIEHREGHGQRGGEGLARRQHAAQARGVAHAHRTEVHTLEHHTTARRVDALR